jgi:hypothetical protein
MKREKLTDSGIDHAGGLGQRYRKGRRVLGAGKGQLAKSRSLQQAIATGKLPFNSGGNKKVLLVCIGNKKYLIQTRFCPTAERRRSA